MKIERTVMTYLFVCPYPCDREIIINADNDQEALDKIMVAGALSCRKPSGLDVCRETHSLCLLTEAQIKDVVRLCLRER